MKRIISILATGLYSIALLSGVSIFIPQLVGAQDGDNHDGVSITETVASEEVNEDSSEESASTYDYVAQLNDNYSLIARKAIQTYGVINDVDLSKNQIIAAETWLTQSAGSPELSVDQDVKISESIIKDNIDRALKLSSEDQEAWAVYADGADFNTDAVGESRE